ncbi:hypothetical protein INT48_001509 [Thamnidium elegans]|uniref:Transmembrane 9 superfamily member n=1 Tax=Thamnidium elegans TaxID=101142 RepID=A0A8H7SGC1_9FUNG|nr:hypothetical protein INT48_001509 [Thamnidium elegans]
MASRAIFIFCCLIVWSHLVFAYKQGDAVPIYYNKIFSLKNQLTYSYQSLSFICSAQQDARKKSLLVFDQDFRGDRLIQSDYKLNFLENQECKLLCKKTWQIEDAIKVEELIADEYLVEWELDGMPGATVSYTNEAPEHNYRIGFPLGFKKGDLTFINNHVIFQILYTVNTNQFGKYDIVGFEVYPDSISNGECSKKNIDYEFQQVTGRSTTVTFTYSVHWKEVKEDVNAWDPFLLPLNKERHNYALLNSIIVVLLVFSVIAVILLKTIHKDNNNQEDKDFKVYDDADDFVGWRLINRDVFRRPIYGGLLTPVMGSGIQLLIVLIGLIVCLYMGWYHPAQPGSLTRWFTLLYLVGSLPAGYWSARIYKLFRGKSWILNSILTAFVAPCAFLLIVFISSMITWSQQSSLAISFSGWVSIFSIWIFVLLPLTCIGAYIGERCERMEHPSRTTQIPRMIPAKRWYQLNIIRILLGGIIPFAVIFLNWHEFLNSVNKGEYVLSIDNTMLVSILLLIATSEITVVLVFLQLCAEDYIWWWQSFMIGASPAVYMFGYGVYFLVKRTNITGLVGVSVYVLNLVIGCGFVGLCTGTLGFLSAYYIIRKIYSSVKVD